MKTEDKEKYLKITESKLSEIRKRLAVLITDRSPSTAESQHDAIRENLEREIVAQEEVIKGMEQFKNFLMQSEEASKIEEGAEFSLSLGDEEIGNALYAPISVALEGIRVITPKSPLGAAIYGKKEGESFSYQAGEQAVSGKITVIK